MKTLCLLYLFTFYKHFVVWFCTLFTDILLWFLYSGFVILVCFPCSFTEEIWTFCSDFMWYSLYILRTLHALLINIMCAFFVYISLTFYAVILDQILLRFNTHFMFSMSLNCCFQWVFTENILRFYKDFCVYYEISVNFAKNLQQKHGDFTDISCDLDAKNVVKFTDIL